MAGATEWLTGKNPIELIEERKAEDPKIEAEHSVILALGEKFSNEPWTANQAAGKPAKFDDGGKMIEPPAGLPPEVWQRVIPLEKGRPNPHAISMWLNRRKDRAYGGMRLVHDGYVSHVARWRIVGVIEL